MAEPTASLIPDLSLEKRPEPILAALLSAEPALNKFYRNCPLEIMEEYMLCTRVMSLCLSPSKPFSYSSGAAVLFLLNDFV